MTTINLAFYTYFYGSNTNSAFRIPTLSSCNYDCYFYTNNETMIVNLQNTGWISIYDNKVCNEDVIESNMVGKHIKTMPHEYDLLQRYDYLCFLDSKLGKVNEEFILYMINEFFIEKNYALLIRKHWFINDNVWNEYNESMKQERYKIESEKYKRYIITQIESGLKETTEDHCACGFLIRNMKHEKNADLSITWYTHIQECGIQDQISFFFVKQLYKEYIHVFTEVPFI